MAASSIVVFFGILYADWWALCFASLGRLRPIVKKLHRPHHAMFSADPSPCPCMSNLQPQLSDEEVASLMRAEVVLPTGPVIKGVDRHGNAVYYPEEYGNFCKAWDKNTDPECQQQYPPARCSQRWCFVNPDCAKRDTHRSKVFPSSDRYVSFETCGSFDAQSAYRCHSHRSQKSCSAVSRDETYPAGGSLCEWSDEQKILYDFKSGGALRKSDSVCQPERCRCTGQHLEEKLPAGLYGSKCSAWDRLKCEEWQKGPDAKIGIWCCQSWCYVDASCPSAAPSSTPGLYWSYAACAESSELIERCPWKEPVSWRGSPVTLSDRSRHILIEGQKKARAKTEAKEYATPPWSMDPTSNVFGIAVVGSGCFILVLCVLCFVCCRNKSSDEDESAAASPAPPAPVAANDPYLLPTTPEPAAKPKPKPQPKSKGRVRRAGFDPL